MKKTSVLNSHTILILYTLLLLLSIDALVAEVIAEPRCNRPILFYFVLNALLIYYTNLVS